MIYPDQLKKGDLLRWCGPDEGCFISDKIYAVVDVGSDDDVTVHCEHGPHEIQSHEYEYFEVVTTSLLEQQVLAYINGELNV